MSLTIHQDSPFENMTFDKWQAAFRPKVDGTWNLHNLLPKELDFFITLSSVSTILGNAGQANYCAGNAFQDALCNFRASQGLRSTSINLGLMSDTEAYTEDDSWTHFLKHNPHLRPVQFKEKDFHHLLIACMRGHTGDGVPIPPQIITAVSDDLERVRDGARMMAVWAGDRKFELRQRATCEKLTVSSASSSAAAGLATLDITTLLRSARTLHEATATVELALRSYVASAITSEAEDIDPEKPVHAYGVDSLKAVEMRNWVFREFKAEVSVFDILGQTSISGLAGRLAGVSKLVNVVVGGGEEKATRE